MIDLGLGPLGTSDQLVKNGLIQGGRGPLLSWRRFWKGDGPHHIHVTWVRLTLFRCRGASDKALHEKTPRLVLLTLGNSDHGPTNFQFIFHLRSPFSSHLPDLISWH